MGLEHADDALVHRLQERHGVGREVHEMYALVEVQNSLGVGRGVVEEHQDLEGEALTEAILPKLGLELVLDVRLEDVRRHPSSLVGVPAHKERVLGVPLKGTWVLSMVHQEGLEFAIPRQVRPQQEGETVLECLEAWGRLLFLCNVRAFRHFLPLKARFIHIENLLGLVTPPPRS